MSLNINRKLYYAGIGSRGTPREMQMVFSQLAGVLEQMNYILRSGGAEGADDAFESGVTNYANKEIFIPWDGYRGSRGPRSSTQQGVFLGQYTADVYNLVSRNHPVWNQLSGGAQKLHLRNANQLLGWPITHESVVKFIVCWTDKGTGKGGTGQALRMAQELGIPIFDFGRMDVPLDDLYEAVILHAGNILTEGISA